MSSLVLFFFMIYICYTLYFVLHICLGFKFLFVYVYCINVLSHSRSGGPIYDEFSVIVIFLIINFFNTNLKDILSK